MNELGDLMRFMATQPNLVATARHFQQLTEDQRKGVKSIYECNLLAFEQALFHDEVVKNFCLSFNPENYLHNIKLLFIKKKNNCPDYKITILKNILLDNKGSVNMKIIENRHQDIIRYLQEINNYVTHEELEKMIFHYNFYRPAKPTQHKVTAQPKATATDEMQVDSSTVTEQRVSGPTVAVICEYDALPAVGHACGHNLIAESGLGAGLAIKTAIENCNVPGKVVVLGTPAEEGCGGKLILIKAGAFKDIDVALMVHPSPDNHLYPPFIGVKQVKVRYIGKEAHASGYPWDGLNALDAAVACYNNVALLRQHIKPTCKVHGIITKGGDAANIIPGNTELIFYYRAASTKEILNLKKRLEACFNSAAIATGCECIIEHYYEDSYESLITNKVLAELYRKHAEDQGVHFEDGNCKVIPFMASSDMGNVSHIVPSIHPTYSIGTKAANHSVAFTEASGKPEAQTTTLIAAQSMALLAVDVMCNPDILNKAKIQFKKDLEEDMLC